MEILNLINKKPGREIIAFVHDCYTQKLQLFSSITNSTEKKNCVYTLPLYSVFLL